MKYRFKTRPFKHQVSALKRLIKQGYLGLLWEPGTGKSKTIVDWASVMSLAGKVERVLIVCPLSVVGVWEDQFAEHCPIPHRFLILQKYWSMVKVKPGRLNILVANYDRAWRRDKIIKKYNPQMVICDESHRIKRISTRRAMFMRKWAKAPYRAILTGTPITKSYLDLYGQWVFLNPRTFGTDIAHFKERYIIFGGFMKKQVKGYRHVPELKGKVKRDASIRRKEDCLDLPEKVYERVPFDLEPQAWSMYEEMATQLFIEFENGEVTDAKNAAVKLLRLHQITGGWVKSEEGNYHRISTAKFDATADLLEDLWAAEEKVVVFARFLPEVDELTNLGLRRNIPTWTLKGATKDKTVWRRFQAQRKGPALFVAQIQSGGLGIQLFTASYAIFYSTTLALDDYVQATDRIHRQGMGDRPATYYHLVGRGTFDEDAYLNLNTKHDVARVIMGNPKLLLDRMRDRGIDKG